MDSSNINSFQQSQQSQQNDYQEIPLEECQKLYEKYIDNENKYSSKYPLTDLIIESQNIILPTDERKLFELRDDILCRILNNISLEDSEKYNDMIGRLQTEDRKLEDDGLMFSQEYYNEDYYDDVDAEQRVAWANEADWYD